MAKAKVFEGRVRIETILTDNEIRKAKALEEKALRLQDEHGDLFFYIGVGKETVVSKYGIEFHNSKAVTDYLIGETGKLNENDEWELNGILAKLTKVEQQVKAVEYPTIEIETVE